MSRPIGQEIYIHIQEELAVGQVFVGELSLYSADGPPRKIAVKCIREVKIDEYLAFVHEHNLGYMVDRNISEAMRFYLVKVLD